MTYADVVREGWNGDENSKQQDFRYAVYHPRREAPKIDDEKAGISCPSGEYGLGASNWTTSTTPATAFAFVASDAHLAAWVEANQAKGRLPRSMPIV